MFGPMGALSRRRAALANTQPPVAAGMAFAWRPNPMPNYSPPTGVTSFKEDIDMQFLKIPLDELPEHECLDYLCYQQPVIKVLRNYDEIKGAYKGFELQQTNLL